MQIAVVGAGPGGSWTSIQLARKGHEVQLLDPQAPWEKPCGGGVTSKVLEQFEIFSEDLPKRRIEEIEIFYGDRSAVRLAPQNPLIIVSRKELGRALLRKAEQCGVRILSERATRVERNGKRWVVATKEQSVEADFLVGADGATSFVRRALGTPLPPEDLCITLGYYIPGDFPPKMKIFFVPSLEGYIWSFPRLNHLSYGLISRSGPGRTARAKELLSNFILADLGPEAMEEAEFYSAPVPCLQFGSWKKNEIVGNGWALVGDAAGLCDPITGEGIYSAFLSGQILAANIDHPSRYVDAIWEKVGRDMAQASRMYKKFYAGQFVGGDFRKRTIQLAHRSRTVKQILEDLISGNQPYLSLRKKLFFSFPAVTWDLVRRRR